MPDDSDNARLLLLLSILLSNLSGCDAPKSVRRRAFRVASCCYRAQDTRCIHEWWDRWNENSLAFFVGVFDALVFCNLMQVAEFMGILAQNSAENKINTHRMELCLAFRLFLFSFHVARNEFDAGFATSLLNQIQLFVVYRKTHFASINFMLASIECLG